MGKRTDSIKINMAFLFWLHPRQNLFQVLEIFYLLFLSTSYVKCQKQKKAKHKKACKTDSFCEIFNLFTKPLLWLQII